MTKNKILNKKQDRESQIIRQSLILFSTNTYSKTSIDHICKKCNISHGLFYFYFKNKEDLLKKIFNKYFSLLEEDIKKFENLSTLEKLKTMTDNFIYKLRKDKIYAYGFNLIFTSENIKDLSKKNKTTKFMPSSFSALFNLFKELNKENKLIHSLNTSFELYIIFCLGITSMYLNNIKDSGTVKDSSFIFNFLIKE